MNASRLVGIALELDRADKPERDILLGIQRYARERGGWTCLLDPLATEASTPRYDGILGAFRPRTAPRAGEGGVPLVAVSHALHYRPFVRVIPNTWQAGRLAAEHLLARGLTRFAYVGRLKDPFADLLLRGFRAAAHAGVYPLFCFRTHQKGAVAAKAWLGVDAALGRWLASAPLPLGCLVRCDILARRLAAACFRTGLRIPEDVAILSIGNDPLLCENPPPTLSALDLAGEEIGHRAARLLDLLMDGLSPPSEDILIPPAGIAVRQSTDLPATFVRLRARGHHVPLRRAWPFLGAALRWIAEHAHERVRLSDVARACGVTVRQLQRGFPRSHGRSVREAVAAARLARAKRLLRGTDLPLAQVARSCGFAGARGLAKLFRRAEGVSPRAYRTARTGE